VALAIVGIVLLVNSSASKSAKTPTTTTGTSTTTTTLTTTQAAAATCPPATGSTKRVVLFKTAPPPCIAATSVWDATFKTSLGDIVVQMPAASSFKAVNNFVFLARYQYYNGTFFHRVIPGFVVQGGDPTGTGTGGATGAGLMKYGYPGYQFTGNTPPASCKTKPTQAGCYVPGDLALANSAGPSTDSSQFFFVLPGGQTTLNGEPNYTNFGHVISGMNVVEKIGADGSSSGTPNVKVYLLSVTMKQISG